jgi:uncharacterized protein YyaL (SSP411 family)
VTRTENRLAAEQSPYLRQHRFDPVDWYPWGDEARARARELDRPLFLSIGYSACHWCHVMAHESFADEATADEMNRSVVAVKVDREEHPDVDAVYMEAVTAASGHGGWPMSIFTTPDGKPFFAGTYFPSEPRHGMPSFRQVLAAVCDIWTSRRADVEAQADALTEAVKERLRPPPPFVAPTDDLSRGALDAAAVRQAMSKAVARLASIADPEHGGFGDAPKFPQPLLLDLLLRSAATGHAAASGKAPLEIVERALEAMASGGIYDQLGGGFARYSVDREWLVPHFEKMLYDQALLARVYLHAWQLTGDERWRQVLDETVCYVLGRLGHPSGALCSAEDADSEGEEGRYYLWSASEFEEVLGRELAGPATSFYGVTSTGNFEGRNILLVASRGKTLRPPAIEHSRVLLRQARRQRVAPGLDDKVLTEWNAMTCSVLAETSAATGNERYASAAERIAEVLRAARARSGGTTPRTVRTDGGAQLPGFAGDVAWSVDASTRLFELTGRTTYLAHAAELADELVREFVDPDAGTVYTTRAGADELVVRPTELEDGVIPSGASVGALALYRLGAILGDFDLTAVAERIVTGLAWTISEAPTAVPELLHAADLISGGVIEVAAVGAGRELLAALRRRYLPLAVFDARLDGGCEPDMPAPLLEGRSDEAVYVCVAGACRLPARDLGQAGAEIDDAVRARAGVGAGP